MSQIPHRTLAASAVAPIIQNAYPPSFGVGGLSPLINLSVRSIQTYRSRFPEKLPPACSTPGSRNPVWLLTDVLNWLASHREPAAALPVSAPSKKPATPTDSPRGRPNLTEMSAALAAGFLKNNGAADVTNHRRAQRANSNLTGGAA